MKAPVDLSGRPKKIRWWMGILIPVLLLLTAKLMAFASEYWQFRSYRAVMVNLCGASGQCLAAVEQHAFDCFDEHYPMGRRNETTDPVKVHACVNQRAGSEVLSDTRR